MSLALPRAFACWGIPSLRSGQALLRYSIRPGRLLFAKSHSGFPRSGRPLFCDLRACPELAKEWCFHPDGYRPPVSIRAVTMFQCTTWPEHSPFWACLPVAFRLSTALASCAHRTCGRCRCDDASITPSFVIHSHLLDGIVASVTTYRLSFPLPWPCQDRQTRVCQTHAWGRCFYSTTWRACPERSRRVRLSLTGTLSCQGLH